MRRNRTSKVSQKGVVKMTKATTSIHITTVSGQLVAEVNGELTYELCDAISDLGLGFGDTLEIEYDLDEYGNEIWGLIDELYETYGK